MKLILADGYTLRVTGAEYNAGISVMGNNSLTIYGQTSGTGKIISTGGHWGAGIGGGWSGSGSSGSGGDGGNITITGGRVFAQGEIGAKDIGGFASASPDGSLTISGTVALFLRNNTSMTPTTSTHINRLFDDHVAGDTIDFIPVDWAGFFGAWLPRQTFAITFDGAGGSPVDDITLDYGEMIILK